MQRRANKNVYAQKHDAQTAQTAQPAKP